MKESENNLAKVKVVPQEARDQSTQLYQQLQPLTRPKRRNVMLSWLIFLHFKFVSKFPLILNIVDYIVIDTVYTISSKKKQRNSIPRSKNFEDILTRAYFLTSFHRELSY